MGVTGGVEIIGIVLTWILYFIIRQFDCNSLCQRRYRLRRRSSLRDFRRNR